MIKHLNGRTEYYQDDSELNLHREDGPAIVWIDGNMEWWLNGLRHREDGPALLWHDGHKEWWLNGVLHRIDGPAIINYCGDKFWFYYGYRIECNCQEEFERIIKLKIFL